MDAEAGRERFFVFGVGFCAWLRWAGGSAHGK
jgi:hypothetical protein